MSEREPEGHPIGTAVGGAFVGGLIAGGNNAGFLGLALLAIGGSFAAMAIRGHVQKSTWEIALGGLFGLSTVLSLPVGFIGMLIGKALWGTP